MSAGVRTREEGAPYGDVANAVGVTRFYDAGCGPCAFFVRLGRGLARKPVRILALDSPV